MDENFSSDLIASLLSEIWTLHKSEGFATYLAEIFGKSVAVHTHFDCIYISQAEEGDIPNAILRSAAKWWQVDDSGLKPVGRPDLSKLDAVRNEIADLYITPMIRFYNEGKDILIGESYGPRMLSRKIGVLSMVNGQVVLTGIRVVKAICFDSK